MSQLQWIVDEYDTNVRQDHLLLLDLVDLTATVHVFNNTFIYSGLYSNPNAREIAVRITYIPLRFNTNLSANARGVIQALIEQYFRVSSVTIVSSGKVLLDSGIELFLPRSDINAFMEEINPLRYSRGHILVGWNIPPQDDMIQVLGWTILVVNPKNELTPETITRQENFTLLERMSNPGDDIIAPYSRDQYQLHSEYLGYEFTVIDASCILKGKDPLDARITYFLVKFLLRDVQANVIYSNQQTRNRRDNNQQTGSIQSTQSINDLENNDSNTYFIITWPVDSEPGDIRLKYMNSARLLNSNIPDTINGTFEDVVKSLSHNFTYGLIERLTAESAWGGRINASDNGVQVYSILYNDVWYNITLPPNEAYFDTINPREQPIDPGVDVTFLEVGELTTSE